jgi:hypothetical protein
VSFTGTTGTSGAGGGTGTSTGTGKSASTSATTSSSGMGVTTGTGGSGTGGKGQGGGIVIDAGPMPDGGPQGPAEVFGHSPDTLYKLDPVTKVVTMVGLFQGCNAQAAAVIDLALDKDGNMFVTTFGGFYKVDKTTAVCTHIADGAYPNSLSFVPKGTLDPNVEALVGYEGADYVRIDPTTGVLTTVKSGALVAGYYSSGDVVSVIGGGTYLTVQGGTPLCNDCIVQVDPSTGAMVKMIGPVGHADVYGLAFWGGSAYGFDDTGHLFQIDLTNGTPTDIPIPGAPPNLVWFGAGSTTSAPLTPTQ